MTAGFDRTAGFGTFTYHGGALEVADFGAESESLATSLPASRAVVLRSFGKAYGLAGLRLGFALASPDIVSSLRAALGA